MELLVENITMAKLITRLRIFDELEKDYVDFLVSHSEKVNYSMMF
jgi:hypothetical protein